MRQIIQKTATTSKDDFHDASDESVNLNSDQHVLQADCILPKLITQQHCGQPSFTVEWLTNEVRGPLPTLAANLACCAILSKFVAFRIRPTLSASLICA